MEEVKKNNNTWIISKPIWKTTLKMKESKKWLMNNKSCLEETTTYSNTISKKDTPETPKMTKVL